MGNQSDATTRFERPKPAPGPARRHSQNPGRAADRSSRDDGAPESTSKINMMTRSATSSVTGRASAMRRMRRRSTTVANSRLFCGTNGCPSFLEFDPETGKATCYICGFVRRID
jgi:hypothetical protein